MGTGAQRGWGISPWRYTSDIPLGSALLHGGAWCGDVQTALAISILLWNCGSKNMQSHVSPFDSTDTQHVVISLMRRIIKQALSPVLGLGKGFLSRRPHLGPHQMASLGVFSRAHTNDTCELVFIGKWNTKKVINFITSSKQPHSYSCPTVEMVWWHQMEQWPASASHFIKLIGPGLQLRELLAVEVHFIHLGFWQPLEVRRCRMARVAASPITPVQLSHWGIKCSGELFFAQQSKLQDILLCYMPAFSLPTTEPNTLLHLQGAEHIIGATQHPVF